MRKHLFLLLAAASIAACAAITPDLPAITESPTGSHDDGRVVWHDLLTTTPEASREFYGTLFGWTFERPGIDLGFGGDATYMLIRHEGELIGGMLDARELEAEGNVSQWITMISTSNVDAAVERARSRGAEIVTEPVELASRGRLAVLRDPDGALFALITARGGDPAAREPVIDGFLWNELWTDDVDAASAFYVDVAGLTRDDREIPGAGRDFRLLANANGPQSGIVANPFEGEKPVWINYLRVADPAAITARVESLGGRVIVDAQPRDIGGFVALVAGPSGAGIALQTWPLEETE
ncbi:MAG: VOC family protein [Woeseiaceae bacterium]|nr:VOC family protein [Woeseiaceae bacterium]